MQLVTCTFEIHASQILAIFNEAIANSTALYDYKPRPVATQVRAALHGIPAEFGGER
jgi:L-amino acid N-acyltransferase